MLVRGDGVSGGGSTKKKTTTPAKTPTLNASGPAGVLSKTSVGQQMLTTAAKNVGAALPKATATSVAASAPAPTPAATKSTAPVLAPASILQATPVGNQIANTTAKTVNAPVVHTPTFLETAMANAKAASAPTSAMAEATKNLSLTGNNSIGSTAVQNQNRVTLMSNATPSIASSPAQKPAVAQSPAEVLASTPIGNQMQRDTYNNLTHSQAKAASGSVQDPKDVLAATPVGQQMQWDAYNAVNQSGNSAAGTPTSSGGSGGGSGGSSGGSSDSGVANNVVTPSLPTFTYDDAPSSGSGTGTGTITLPTKEENTYLTDLVNSRFEYNPATDQGYLQACAAAENSIIQSIIGRGGMYSSVAQSAVATKLSDLAIEYEKAAYDKYTSERTYKMQLAQFEQDRIDTAYDEAFAAIKYQNDYAQQQYENYINSEQQKFENQLNLAQFQFTLDKETFDQNQTIAAANLAAQKSYSSSQASSAKAATATQDADVQTQLYNLQVQKSKFNQYKTQWANSGRASKEVASYFSAYGVSVGASISDFTDVVNGVENSINNQIYSLSQQAIEIGEGKFASQFMDDYTKPATAIQSGTSADTSTSAQTSFYYQTLNQLTGSKVTAKQTAQLIKDLTTNSKYSAYQTKMGSYYFGKLLDALNAQKIALQKSSSSSSVFS